MQDDDKRTNLYATRPFGDPCRLVPEPFASAAPSSPLETIRPPAQQEEGHEPVCGQLADAVWARQEEEQFWEEDREINEKFRWEGPTLQGASCNERGGYVPTRPPEPPKRLMAAVPSSGGPTWTVSAPDIEQAIYTLMCKLERSPTDDEISEKLHLTKDRYYEALALLNDIENEIGIRTMKPGDVASSNLAFLSNARGDAVFCCLRSEMLNLFKAAVSTLPERELLIIQLRYAEDFTGVEISLTLNIDESTLTRLSASAHLHLRARLYGSMEADHWIGGDRVQPAQYKGLRKDLTGPKAHVYMSAERCGWLPTGYTWESLGSSATFRHFMQTYFLINGSGELERVEHSEHVELRVEGYRGNNR